jgi:chemotaxis protein methyltransferase CheR
MSSLSLSLPLFMILREIIEQHTGIHYAEADLDLFTAKISARAAEIGFDSLLDYYYLLRYDDKNKVELDALADALVVNESYFFREIDPLKVMIERVIRPKVESGITPRIWSAACSTGEEPLSIAMMLHNRGMLARTQIIASDLSPRVLAKAQSGVFSGRSLRIVPHPEAREHIVDGRISPALVRHISWHQHNLIHRAPFSEIDVILCRNVLIYFSDDTAAKVIDNLSRALVRGGQILVGVSESLLRFGTALRCVERDGSFFYEGVA